MVTVVIRRFVVALCFLVFIGVAVLIVLKPSIIDTGLVELSNRRTSNISNATIIHPTLRQVKEVIKVNNVRIVPQDDTELAFLYSGTLASVSVKEGDVVEEGAVLANLDTKSLLLEEKRAVQNLAGAEANLLKLRNGTRKEAVAVSLERERLLSSEIDSARSALRDVLIETYTKVDDAFSNKLKSIISTERGEDPKFLVPLHNELLEDALIARHTQISPLLVSWKKENQEIAQDASIITYTQTVERNLAAFTDFFDEIVRAVNAADAGATNVVAGRNTMATIRTTMTELASALVSAKSLLTSVEGEFRVATSERVLTEAPTETEDIEIAITQVEVARNQLSIVRDNINRATLRAPFSGMIVKKIHHKSKEVVQGGESVMLLAMPTLKVRVDVFEEDIANVAIGSTVTVSLKSYRDRILNGKVVSIEPNEIVKNESTYFRANIFFDDIPLDMILRPGMTGDAFIVTGREEPALFLPKRVLLYKNGQYMASIRKAGILDTIPLTLGDSEGDLIEVIGDINVETEVIVE